MPKYFFNIVLDGQPTASGDGKDLPDERAARAHAHHLAVLLSDRPHDLINSFVAVSGSDSRLMFKVPFSAMDHGPDGGSGTS